MVSNEKKFVTELLHAGVETDTYTGAVARLSIKFHFSSNSDQP